MLVSDEADGFLHSLRDKKGWQADLMAKITDLYDGLAEPIQRRGETGGEFTKTSFSMFLSGTEVKIMEELDRTMFESGFLARVLWFVGERLDVPMELKGVRFTAGKRMEGQDEQIAEWRRKFTAIRERWTFAHFGKQAFIHPDSQETADWFHATTAKIEDGALFDKSEDGRVMTAAATRTNVSAAKIGALIAIADSRDTITKDDFLVALWLLEQCLGDMVYMFRQVASSEHSKNLDKLETIIAGKSTGMHSSEVYRIASNRGWTKRDVDAMVEELRSQKRLKSKPGALNFGYDWTIIE
jgi:hypothetical protein